MRLHRPTASTRVGDIKLTVGSEQRAYTDESNETMPVSSLDSYTTSIYTPVSVHYINYNIVFQFLPASLSKLQLFSTKGRCSGAIIVHYRLRHFP